ncbi:unnamed protein product [Brugia pahangi]|uniref:Secreted protein n=2 Tax=Brugia TaxID=6278 RepID=A0A0N4T3A8_BRUPA|nr:unnamed protein product [Brugia pahangi]VDO30551.1 unnamed protein product [Brugia timori]
MIRRVRSICSIISGSLSYAVGESTGNCPDVRYRWKIVVPVKDLQDLELELKKLRGMTMRRNKKKKW